MARPLDVTGAWKKLDRAKTQIKALQAEFESSVPDPENLPVYRQFEDERSAIVYYIESVVSVKEEWSLLCGEIVHNMRCALDHLTWQLATRKFKGKEPPEPQPARSVQFPIISDGKDWALNKYRKWATLSDIAKLKKFQPFKQSVRDRKAGIPHRLGMLADLSNIDKHRKIHLTFFFMATARFSTPQIHDCELVDPQSPVVWTRPSGFAVNPRDEIFYVPIIRRGPKPDVDFKSTAQGEIRLGEQTLLFKTLYECWDAVSRVLNTKF